MTGPHQNGLGFVIGFHP